VDEDRRANLRAMLQKRHQAGTVQVVVADMVADLHAGMARS
jgi:hypothetical protein